MAALSFLFLGSLLVPVLTQALVHADAACNPTVSATLVNSCRPWLGAAAYNYDAATANVPAQIAYHEKRLSNAFDGTDTSRQLDIVHTYHSPGSNTLSATDLIYANRAHTLLYTNWKPTTNWANIATQNAAIDSMANSIKALGSIKIFLTLFHEPEDDVSPNGDPNCPNVAYKGSAGTVADYRNMWAYTEARFAADGVTNVVWVMNYMSFSNWDCLVPDLYPGDNLIDWITFDPYGGNVTPNYVDNVGRFYNLLTTDSSTTPDPVTGLTHNFLSKPWGLAEWGATNSTPQEQQFYDDAKAGLDNGTYPKLKMYMIFDERSGQSPTGTNRRVGYEDNGSVNTTKGSHYYAFANDPNIMGSWQAADTVAPSVPGGLTASVVGTNRVDLNWTASNDNISVTGYDIYRNGTKIATVPSVSYSDLGLTDATTYQYAVVAFDAAGNRSAQSTAVAAVVPDGTAPDVPSGLTATAINIGEVDLTWATPHDNVGVTGYRVYRDGALIASPSNVTTYQDITVTAQTTYSYTIAAVDAAGNASAQSTAVAATTPAVVAPPDTTAPTVPSGLAGTAATSGGTVNLSWQSSTDDTAVVGYTIFRDGQQIATVPAANTTYTDTGLTDGVSYSYTINAYDAAANASAQSQSVSVTMPVQVHTPPPDTTPPTTPTGLAATAASPSEIDLTWTASTDDTGVTGYQVYRGTTLVATTPNTAYADTGLTGSTSYAYTIVAVDAAGNASAASTAVTAVTLVAPDVTAPTVPDGLVATAISDSEIDLTWNASTDNIGVTGYQIWRDGSLLTTIGNVTSYQDIGLTSQTAHSYTIVALDAAANASAQSQAASATTKQTLDLTPPSAPTILTATLSGTSEVDLAWQPATDNVGVTGYLVYRDGVLLATLPATANSYADLGLADATTYSYTVFAFDAAGNTSVVSNTANASTPDTTPPTAPTGLTPTILGGSSVRLDWQAATDKVGVTSYRVYRDGILLPTVVTGTTYTDTGLTNATAYQYAITAVDAAGNTSARSTPANTTTLDTAAPTVPTSVSTAVSSGTSVTVSWTASTDNVGVVGYQIYRNGSLLATVPTGTSYLDTGLAIVTPYTYTIAAVDAAGNASAQSTGATATIPDTIPPSAPSNLLAVAQSNGTSVNLTWTAATDNIAVTGYQIYRGTTLVTTVTSGTNYLDTGLANGTTYSYKVYAIDAAGNQSAGSNTASTTTLTPDTTAPAAVVLTASAASPTQVNLSWTPSSDNIAVTGYRVYRGATLIATVTDITYQDSGLTPSVAYSYKVYAIDGAGNQSVVSNVVSVPTPPNKPTNFKVLSVTATSETLTWTAPTYSTGIVSYQLLRKNVVVATITATSATTYTFVDTGLTPNTSYTYHINAIDTLGTLSAQATAPTLLTAADTTPPSTPTSVTAVTGTTTGTVKLSWAACTDDVGVTGYRVYRGSTLITTVSGTTLTYTDTGLTSGTTYSYHIVAIDAAGNASANSATVSAKAK